MSKTPLQSALMVCIFFVRHSDNYLIGLQASPRHLLSLAALGGDEEASAKSVRNSSTFERSLAKAENANLLRILGARKRCWECYVCCIFATNEESSKAGLMSLGNSLA
jgi:hypothetical protein